MAGQRIPDVTSQSDREVRRGCDERWCVLYDSETQRPRYRSHQTTNFREWRSHNSFSNFWILSFTFDPHALPPTRYYGSMRPAQEQLARQVAHAHLIEHVCWTCLEFVILFAPFFRMTLWQSSFCLLGETWIAHESPYIHITYVYPFKKVPNWRKGR